MHKNININLYVYITILYNTVPFIKLKIMLSKLLIFLTVNLIQNTSCLIYVTSTYVYISACTYKEKCTLFHILTLYTLTLHT